MSFKKRLKTAWFGLIGKDPEAVVVTLASGDRSLCEAMIQEVQQLLPERRHFVVWPDEFRSAAALRLRFRAYRIGMMPVMFDGDPRFAQMRRAAFVAAPRKVLAYNARLERHHLRLRTWIASLLFLRGAPLDRIFLRPWWLFPLAADRNFDPGTYEVIEGRNFREGYKRVAVVTPYFPYPLSHGGVVRIFHLLREASKDFDIVLYAFRPYKANEVTDRVAEFCARIYLVDAPRYRRPRWSTLIPPEVLEYRSKAMRRLLKIRAAQGIHLTQIEYTQLASYSGEVLVEHDVTFDLYAQIHLRQRRLQSWWNWQRWKKYETSAVKRFRRVIVMSEADQRILGGIKTSVIGNGVDLDRFRPVIEPPGRRMLFVGSFRHFPNILAFRFFLEEVFPRVLAAEPEAELTVVAGPDAERYWRENTGISRLPQHSRLQLYEFVADVQPLYAACNLVVVPTLVSAGTNLKVLEAMASMRAVVSTRCGCQGLSLTDRQSVWIADQADSFAEAAVHLLRDHEARASMAAKARHTAAERFGWQSLGLQQRELWRELLGLKYIRFANEEDLSAISTIQAKAPDASQWEPALYLGFSTIVAVNGREIIGFLVSRRTAEDECEILNVVVREDQRRQGIATRLLKYVLNSDCQTAFLEVRESNSAAICLYRRLGFKEIGKRAEYYENPPEGAIVMRYQSC